MDRTLISYSLTILLLLLTTVMAINIPLESPLDSFIIGNDTNNSMTIFTYPTEEVRAYEVENTTYVINWPAVNTSQTLGYQKWKSLARLFYLNETGYDDNISFALTLRSEINNSEVAELETDYGVNITSAFFSSTIGGGITEYPPDEERMDAIEELVRNYSLTYHNITNFTLIEGYYSLQGIGNISSIMGLLYDNNTFCVDPGPHDLMINYPNATFIPANNLYYAYSNYTTCNGSLRTNETDVDNDLFLSCEGDCNNTNSGIHPGAVEIKDGVDNDCDGLIDECQKGGIYTCLGALCCGDTDDVCPTVFDGVTCQILDQDCFGKGVSMCDEEFFCGVSDGICPIDFDNVTCRVYDPDCTLREGIDTCQGVFECGIDDGICPTDFDGVSCSTYDLDCN